MRLIVTRVPNKTKNSENESLITKIVQEISNKNVYTDKNDLLDFYEAILDLMWKTFQITLGTTTVSFVCQKAIAETTNMHKSAAHITISHHGLSLKELRTTQEKIEISCTEINAVIKNFIENVLLILSLLTGTIMLKHFLGELKKFSFSPPNRKQIRSKK